MAKGHRLLLIAADDESFCCHHLLTARAASKAGYAVTVVCHNTGRSAPITAEGFNLISVKYPRQGWSLATELVFLYRLVKILRHASPDMVHALSLRMSFLAAIANVMARIPRRV